MSEDLALALVAGEYRVTTVRLPAGFTVRSMTYGATDLLNSPLRVDGPANTRIEVTLRTCRSGVNNRSQDQGARQDAPGEGTPRPTTVAFSATQSGGQTFETPIRDDGSFQFAAGPTRHL